MQGTLHHRPPPPLSCQQPRLLARPGEEGVRGKEGLCESKPHPQSRAETQVCKSPLRGRRPHQVPPLRPAAPEGGQGLHGDQRKENPTEENSKHQSHACLLNERMGPKALLYKRHASIRQGPQDMAGAVCVCAAHTSAARGPLRPHHTRAKHMCAHADAGEDTHHRLFAHVRPCPARVAHLSFTWFCAPGPPLPAPSPLPPLWTPPAPLHSTSVRSSMMAVSLGSSRLNSRAKRMKWT